MNVLKNSWRLSVLLLSLLPCVLLAQPETNDAPAFVSENYQRFGLQPGNIPEKWEDGARTTGERGTFEWWYFDGFLQDGSAIVVVFYTKDFALANGQANPTIAFNLSRPDGTAVGRRVSFPTSEATFATDSCNVQMGPNYFRGNLQNYVLHFEEPGFSFTANLTRSSNNSWRPKTGHMVFGDTQEYYMGWMVAVPSGFVQAEIVTDGTVENLAGLGYHDHNWGNTRLQKLFNHWYWARATFGPYTVIASEMIAAKEYDKEPINVVHIAKNGQADRR